MSDYTALRRHVCYLSDMEVAVLERAVRVYAQVISIQTAASSRHETANATRVSAMLQNHQQVCKCPVPPDPAESTTTGE